MGCPKQPWESGYCCCELKYVLFVSLIACELAIQSDIYFKEVNMTVQLRLYSLLACDHPLGVAINTLENFPSSGLLIVLFKIFYFACSMLVNSLLANLRNSYHIALRHFECSPVKTGKF